MNNKGYIFTVSTFFLLSVVLFLALFFSTRDTEIDISGPKLFALYDDIRHDLFELLEVNVTKADFDNFTVIMFEEELPATGVRNQLKAYENYVENTHTSEVSTQLDERVGSPAGADVSMSLSRSSFFLEPYSYLYEYDTFSKDEIYIYPQDNNSNLLGLVVNLSIAEDINNLSANIIPGDLPVRIVIDSGNLDYDNTTNISRTEESVWMFNRSGEFVTIRAGMTDVNGKNLNSTCTINLKQGVHAQSSIMLVFRESMHFMLESGFTITLRDILGYRLAEKEDTPFTEVIDFTRIKDNVWFTVYDTNLSSLPLYVPSPGAPPEGEEEPDLLGFCYCQAPCYYWEELWSGGLPCELRLCPEWCGEQFMLTYLL